MAQRHEPGLPSSIPTHPFLEVKVGTDYRNTAENTAEQKLKGLVLNQVESTYKDQLESSKVKKSAHTLLNTTTSRSLSF